MCSLNHFLPTTNTPNSSEGFFFVDFILDSRYNQHRGKLFVIYASLYLYMDTLKINIINPKALKLLNDLADMNLISIQDSPKNNFAELLSKLRSNSNSTPNLDEITKEVEAVRAKRYAR